MGIKGKYIVHLILLFAIIINTKSFAQTPVKNGTTAASFLEIGVGSAATGMGGAYTTIADDISSIYWNPSRLATIENYEAMFVHQPWIAGMAFNFFGLSFPVENVGVFGLGITQLSSGDIEETTLDYQEGTGATFNAASMAVSLVYSKNITNWFSVGFSGKYITERIATMNSSALAVDMGVYVVTPFFERENVKGIQIGMVISNFGTKLRLQGDETFIAVDPDPNNGGNNDKIEAHYAMDEYNLPTTFRVGLAYDLINTVENHRITIALDLYHPNNNYEYMNVGAQYQLPISQGSELKFRAGYETLFLPDSQKGLTFGLGVNIDIGGVAGLRFDYAYSDIGVLGNVSSYTLSLLF